MSYHELKLCKDEVLYCEGGIRPYWRGKFHFLVSILFFITFFILIQKSETTTEIISTILFSFINMTSYMISYCYHCINWSPTTEIFMEKCDHILIYINTANNITQLCLLAIRNNRLLIVFIAWIASMYAGYSIISRRKSVYHKLLCAIPVTFALPQMFSYMSTIQISLFVAAWGQTFLGAMAYVTQSPNIWPEYFGYHEVMHLLTSTAALTAIALQYHLLESFDSSHCLLSGMEGSFRDVFWR